MATKRDLVRMPADFDELTVWWDGWQYGQGIMDRRAKRLLLCAPDVESWTDVATGWSASVHYPSRAGIGLSEDDLDVITEGIV